METGSIYCNGHYILQRLYSTATRLVSQEMGSVRHSISATARRTADLVCGELNHFTGFIINSHLDHGVIVLKFNLVDPIIFIIMNI